MNYPDQIIPRPKIDALTGIKSSLDKIRSVIALVYLLYLASDRKAFVKYSVPDGNKISINPSYLSFIEQYLGKTNLKTVINNNPLIVNQYEPLYVGITLLFKLGILKMEGKSSTAERTGGVRYPKQLYFANNTIILDLIINGFTENEIKTSLLEWLQNSKASNNIFEKRISMFLTTCTSFTQFKVRKEDGQELFFQTEGIYNSLINNGSISLVDSHEYVGPTRIYNNVLKEGLEPWIKINNGDLSFKDLNDPDAETIKGIISTTLDIYNVKDDSIAISDSNDTADEQNDNSEIETPLQKIYYGTPGSGKSDTVRKITEKKYHDENERNEYVFRTTFHPDSDYASFVGCYKPQMDADNNIIYEYTPQAFTNAYIKAWQNTGKEVYLIIEEINRGNCAQIFGDLFQLLDRKDGVSEYSINADADLKQYLMKEDILGEQSEGIKDGKLKLPKNLHILATMNTSDQSLFPMDSAFKRRWSWECVPINYNHPESSQFKIILGNKKYNWNKFLKEVNSRIFKATDSEDKQMGNFFINGDIDERDFIDKVMFYLWNDICKEELGTNNNFFRNYTNEQKNENVEFTFNNLFEPGRSTELLQGFMDFIGVDEIVNTTGTTATQ